MYDFFVDNNTFDISDITNIYKHFVKNHDMK